MVVQTLATAGGLFGGLAFWHFVVDFVFQTHRQAMQKHANGRVRAEHCLVYTGLFLPVLFLLQLRWQEMLVGSLVLFGSHFVGDSYVPVYLWVRYVRRPPGVVPRRKGYSGSFVELEALTEFASTPLGKFLVITVDQLFHLSFLWFLVWLALN